MTTVLDNDVQAAVEAALGGKRTVLLCPSHDDNTPSLSVGPGKTQPVVLHCLAGETRVVTREGTYPIQELAGGVHELLTPGQFGPQWRKVPVSLFGEQSLLRLTLRRHSATKVIHATPEHRWFVQHRESATRREVVTADLTPGSRLSTIVPRRRVQTVSTFGVAHGFVYGDGSLTARGTESMAQFCGPKDDALLPYFPMMQVRQYGEAKRVSGLPIFFKAVPSITESPAYLAGWLAGYFAADGSMEGHCAVLSSASRESLEFVRDVATRLGITTYPIRERMRLGYGSEPSALFSVVLKASDLWSEFFILPSHRLRWESKSHGSDSREAWRVVSVEATDRVEEVYCATVREVGAFALEDSILTGNCHTGCSQEEIITAAGLDWDAVCAPRDPELHDRDMWTPRGTASHVYPYRSANGTLLFEVLRVPLETGRKSFLQRKPDAFAPHGHAWNLDGVERVIYRLPQVIGAVRDGRTVHVAEGEKCVHALLRVIGAGEEATCNPGGAGKWLPEFSSALAGANVVVYADADDTGRLHARQVRDSLLEVGATVKIMEAPSGLLPSGKPINDVADHLEAGRLLADLLETTPESAVERAKTGIDVLDLVQRPRGRTEFVIDGTLAKGERLILIGFEGTGKSTLCRQIAVMVAAGLHPFTGAPMTPRKVLFIDAENHPEQTLDSWNQLVGLAGRHGAPLDRGALTVLEEYESDRDLTSQSGSDWLHERVFAYQPDLVVMGPLTNLASRDLRDDEPVRKIKNAVNSARTICNSAFIMEHHAPLKGSMDKERPLRPYGSSLFLKWPDYGYGIKPTEDPALFEWFKNRGARVRSRVWPEALREGTPNSAAWPWMQDMLP